MPDILDSDFLGDKEKENQKLPVKKEPLVLEEAWWEIYLQEGEKILLDKSVIEENPPSPPVKTSKEKEQHPVIFGLGCFSYFGCAGIFIGLLLGIVVPSKTVTIMVIFFFLIASIFTYQGADPIIVREENFSKRRLILTSKQILISEKPPISIKDVFSIKIKKTAPNKIIFDVKRSKPLELELPSNAEAETLLKTVQKMLYITE